METHFQRGFILTLLIFLMLSACTPTTTTEDWKVFAIEEEPAIDIQFRLPPEWYVDYSPKVNTAGQWDVALVPPKCAEDQEQEFSDNCVSLTIQIKGISDFDKPSFLDFISQSFTLNQSGTEKTVLMGQNSFTVNGITVFRYNHKLYIGEDEVQMSFLFFETESAYFTFVIELPYEEREGEIADQFNLLVNSIEVID